MAGIYIPNLEMPATCCHCKLMVYNPEIVWDDSGIQTVGAWVCLLTRELINNTKREEHCPVIFVPDHGDLIERDKLRKTMFIGEQCLYSWDEVEDAIDYAPTIIPADKEAT